MCRNGRCNFAFNLVWRMHNYASCLFLPLLCSLLYFKHLVYSIHSKLICNYSFSPIKKKHNLSKITFRRNIVRQCLTTTQTSQLLANKTTRRCAQLNVVRMQLARMCRKCLRAKLVQFVQCHIFAGAQPAIRPWQARMANVRDSRVHSEATRGGEMFYKKLAVRWSLNVPSKCVFYVFQCLPGGRSNLCRMQVRFRCTSATAAGNCTELPYVCRLDRKIRIGRHRWLVFSKWLLSLRYNLSRTV